MDADRKAFYEYHAALMEPWDGPAAVAFTDGRQIGATLDRNGLRPARYIVTDDDRVIMASEAGVLPIPAEKIMRKWRLQPGKMLLIDLKQGRIVSDEEIKAELATAHPYKTWLGRTQIVLEDLQPVEPRALRKDVSLLDRQQAFGYTQEDTKLLMSPMATTGQEAVGSMGTDTPISAMSDKSKMLYTYFKQNFAQVTNPPIDSDPRGTGDEPGLVHRTAPQRLRPDRRRRGASVSKFASRSSPTRIWKRSAPSAAWRTTRSTPRRSTSPIQWRKARRACPARWNAAVLRARRDGGRIGGYNIIILSDRQVGRDRVAIPALLATAGVHHHLIRKGLRTSVGLVVESGEPREVHHFCCLAGYGAEAINPYLAFETLVAMKDHIPVRSRRGRARLPLHQGDR